MLYVTLAESDWEGFIRGAVILLVIASSVLGPIAKKLIEAYSSKKSQDGIEPKKKTITRSIPSPLPQPSKPFTPIDRPPLMVQRQAEVGEARPLSTSRGRSAKQQVSTRKPRRVPPSKVSVRSQLAMQIELAGRQQTEQPQELRSRHLHSRLEQEGERVAGEVERRLGHIEGTLRQSLDVPTSPGEIGRQQVYTRLTARSLRRAIVLSEILAPPIALRSPDQGLSAH